MTNFLSTQWLLWERESQRQSGQNDKYFIYKYIQYLKIFKFTIGNIYFSLRIY
jgi:hypothetical protein